MKNKYVEKAFQKNKNIKKKKDINWIIKITIAAFLITIVMSLIAESALNNVSIFISIIIMLIFIFLGIIFDMIGIAVTVADKKVFNSMAAKKVKGAKTGIKLMKNSNKVASFCNDVIGDICGILSGSAASTIALLVTDSLGINIFISTLLITSIIAALTIGGKAWGKSIAINNANNILYEFSKFICIFKKEK